MTLERWVALGAGLLLLASCWRVASASLKRGDGLVTAETVFLAAWGSVLVVFAAPWVRYTESSLLAWTAIYASIATFLIGCWAARQMLKDLPGGRVDGTENIDRTRFSITWLVVFVLGAIGFAGFVHAIDVTMGWQALFNNPAATRAAQSASQTFKHSYGIWKLLSYATPVSLLLWSIGVRGRLFKGPWVAAYPVGLLALVPYVFTSERGLLVNSLLWILMFHLIWRPPAHPRRLLAVMVSTVAVALIVFSVLGERAGKTLSSHPEIASQVTAGGPQQLVLPYVYVTANIPAFSQLTEDPIRPQTLGKLTALPLVKALHRAGVGSTPPEQSGAYYPIPFETFNNLTWLSSLYQDFGLVGCIFMPLLFGFLACWLVLLALRKGSLLAIWLGSLALFVVGYTPVVNRLTSTFVWEYAIAGPIVIALIRSRPGPIEWLRSIPTRAKSGFDHPGRAAAVAAAAALLVVPGVVVAFTSGGGAKSPEATVRNALSNAHKTRVDGGYPGDRALASRLHAADPTNAYSAICNEASVPEKRGVVGVFTDGARIRVTFHARNGRVVSSAPPAIDLAGTTRSLSVNLNGTLHDELPPDRDGRFGRSVTRLILPSSPRVNARINVSFTSNDPGLAGAHPYFLRRYCTENLLAVLNRWKLTPTPMTPRKRSGQLTQFDGSALADRPGLTWIDVYVDRKSAVEEMRRSTVGPYTVTVTPPK